MNRFQFYNALCDINDIVFPELSNNNYDFTTDPKAYEAVLPPSDYKYPRDWNTEYQNLREKVLDTLQTLQDENSKYSVGEKIQMYQKAIDTTNKVANVVKDFHIEATKIAQHMIDIMNRFDDIKLPEDPDELIPFRKYKTDKRTILMFLRRNIIFKFVYSLDANEMESIYKEFSNEVNNNYMIQEALTWRSPLDSPLAPLSLQSTESFLARNYNYHFGKYVVAQNLLTLIDYKGFRVLASARIPVSKGSLLYGSLDGGNTIVKKDPNAEKMVAIISEYFNLKSRKLTSSQQKETQVDIPLTADLQVYLGSDSRVYITGAQSLAPPVVLSVPPNTKAALVNHLRPEFLRNFTTPLPCSLSTWDSLVDSQFKENFKAISEATNEIFRVNIPLAAHYLDGALAAESSDKFTVKDILHTCGVNFHFAGHVRTHEALKDNKRTQTVLLVEMIARCVMKDLKKNWRQIHLQLLFDNNNNPKKKKDTPSSCQEVTLKYFNLLFGNTEASLKFWTIDLKNLLQDKFGVALLEHEKDANYNLQHSVSMLMLLRKISHKQEPQEAESKFMHWKTNLLSKSDSSIDVNASTKAAESVPAVYATLLSNPDKPFHYFGNAHIGNPVAKAKNCAPFSHFTQCIITLKFLSEIESGSLNNVSEDIILSILGTGLHAAHEGLSIRLNSSFLVLLSQLFEYLKDMHWVSSELRPMNENPWKFRMLINIATHLEQAAILDIQDTQTHFQLGKVLREISDLAAEIFSQQKIPNLKNSVEYVKALSYYHLTELDLKTSLKTPLAKQILEQYLSRDSRDVGEQSQEFQVVTSHVKSGFYETLAELIEQPVTFKESSVPVTNLDETIHNEVDKGFAVYWKAQRRGIGFISILLPLLNSLELGADVDLGSSRVFDSLTQAQVWVATCSWFANLVNSLIHEKFNIQLHDPENHTGEKLGEYCAVTLHKHVPSIDLFSTFELDRHSLKGTIRTSLYLWKELVWMLQKFEMAVNFMKLQYASDSYAKLAKNLFLEALKIANNSPVETDRDRRKNLLIQSRNLYEQLDLKNFFGREIPLSSLPDFPVMLDALITLPQVFHALEDDHTPDVKSKLPLLDFARIWLDLAIVILQKHQQDAVKGLKTETKKEGTTEEPKVVQEQKPNSEDQKVDWIFTNSVIYSEYAFNFLKRSEIAVKTMDKINNLIDSIKMDLNVIILIGNDSFQQKSVDRANQNCQSIINLLSPPKDSPIERLSSSQASEVQQSLWKLLEQNDGFDCNINLYQIIVEISAIHHDNDLPILFTPLELLKPEEIDDKVAELERMIDESIHQVEYLSQQQMMWNSAKSHWNFGYFLSRLGRGLSDQLEVLESQTTKAQSKTGVQDWKQNLFFLFEFLQLKGLINMFYSLDMDPNYPSTRKEDLKNLSQKLLKDHLAEFRKIQERSWDRLFFRFTGLFEKQSHSMLKNYHDRFFLLNDMSLKYNEAADKFSITNRNIPLVEIVEVTPLQAEKGQTHSDYGNVSFGFLIKMRNSDQYAIRSKTSTSHFYKAGNPKQLRDQILHAIFFMYGTELIVDYFPESQEWFDPVEKEFLPADFHGQKHKPIKIADHIWLKQLLLPKPSESHSQIYHAITFTLKERNQNK